MFKQRLLTTLILIPLVLLAIYWAPFLSFALLTALIMLLCGAEFLNLIPLKFLWLKVIYLAALISLTVVMSHVYFHLWVMAGLVLWVLIFLALLSYPRSQALWGWSGIVAFSGLVLLPLFAESLLRVYAFNKDLLVYILLLVWATDIGAYLFGKQWGRHKLIPLVSPGKTWEGFSGGVLLSMLVAVLGYFYFAPKGTFSWFAVALLTILGSMVGDLFISMLKRRSKLKDTGQLLPGHGGLLDRLDSLMAALPLFYCGYAFFNRGLLG
ncbi:MAG: CDP-archaeol synthase [Tatlockia sp.]|jgi:CDP-diglyceride synthetase